MELENFPHLHKEKLPACIVYIQQIGGSEVSRFSSHIFSVQCVVIYLKFKLKRFSEHNFLLGIKIIPNKSEIQLHTWNHNAL